MSVHTAAGDGRPTGAGLAGPDWGSPVVVAPLAILLGLGVGVGVALASPVVPPIVAPALVVGLAGAVGVAASLHVGLLALVAVASLLPFAVIPVRIGIQLTVVDALTGAIVLGWFARVWAREGRLELTIPGRLMAAYLGVAVAALLAGWAYAPLDGPAIRGFLKYAVAILLLPVVVDVVRDARRARSLVRALLVCGALAAAVALAIHAMPRVQIVDLLSSLSAIGYPSGRDVLRFRPGPNDTYTDVLRATGTSIDPNVLGGLLMLAGALMLGQGIAPRPVVPRWTLLPAAAVTAAAMVATDSRSSWVGLAAAWAFLALVRERRLWLLAVPAGLALTLLPTGRVIVERLISGFAGRDRAAALRLDEYRQAFDLISDYPVLGVGFGGAPELGTFVGVSNIYLLVGEQTGLLGLALFVAAVATLLVSAIVAHKPTGAPGRPADDGLLPALAAAFVAALVAGLFDHYFMNPRFPHMVALFWLYGGLLGAATRLTTEQIRAATAIPDGITATSRASSPDHNRTATVTERRRPSTGTLG